MANTSRSDIVTNAGIFRTDRTADSAEQQLIVDKYRGNHDTSFTFKHAGGPIPDDRSGLPTYLCSYTVESGGLFRTAAPIVQITGRSGTHMDNEGNFRVKCKKINPSSKYGNGAYLLWYIHMERHMSHFILGRTYLQAMVKRGPELRIGGSIWQVQKVLQDDLG